MNRGKRPVKKIIHVNQHVIKHNTKTGDNQPPLTVKIRGKEHVVPLSNCPMCNGEADFVEFNETVWIAECTGCGLALGYPYGYSSRLELANDWNKRYRNE